MRKHKTQQGYIMLTSLIILSAVLLLIAVVISQINYSGRMNIWQLEQKTQSANLAETCLGFALLNLREDLNYQPKFGGSIFQASPQDDCLIAKIENNSSYKDIKTQANFRGSFTNLLVTVDPNNNFKVLAYKECLKFTAPDFNDACN